MLHSSVRRETLGPDILLRRWRQSDRPEGLHRHGVGDDGIKRRLRLRERERETAMNDNLAEHVHFLRLVSPVLPFPLLYLFAMVLKLEEAIWPNKRLPQQHCAE